MRSRRRAGWLTWVGVLLLAAGVACLGYLGYQLFGTNAPSERAFRQETAQLQQSWRSPGPSAGTDRSGPDSDQDADQDQPRTQLVPGGAIALLRIPRFGADYQVPILQGTDLAVLARGVGHYPGTALPGQLGNFAIAGHRITHGQPFARLLQLRTGDLVTVETREAVYSYAIDTPPSALTVTSSASWVLDPVPGHADTDPSRKLITLTTCSDLFHSPNRSVGFGHLVHTQQK